jgi:protease-4
MLNFYLVLLLAAGLEDGFAHATIREGKRDQIIAIYKITGVIDGAAAEQFASFCAEVRKNRNVRAIVLRVNSPGGGVSAADQVHNLVKQLQETGKKVVVSMGAVAASGGYYVSASADEILAEPTTITGSIGVLMTWPVLRGTLEKIGVESVVIKSSNARGWKDEISYLQKPDTRQREHLQEMLDTIQEKFEEVVRQGRGERLKTREVNYSMRIGEGEDAREIDAIETEPLNGKVYLPDKASELGLIDRIGYLADAIDRAGAVADLDDPKVVRYEVRRGLLVELLEGKGPSVLDLNVESLDEFQTPRILLMWKVE